MERLVARILQCIIRWELRRRVTAKAIARQKRRIARMLGDTTQKAGDD